MHRFLLLIVFIFSQLAFSCQPKAATEPTANETATGKDILVPYRDGDRWGFARPDGSIVVAPTYDQVYVSTDGYGRTFLNERSGLIAPNGELILPPTYSSIGEFEQGLATVYTSGGQQGFINTSGKVVIATVYDEAYSFQGNRCVVKKMDKYLLLNPAGEVVASLADKIMPVFGDMYMEGSMPTWKYDPGYMLIQHTDNYLMGLIDTNGQVLLKPIYSSLSLPMQGAMIATLGEKTGLIDVSGKEITTTNFNYLYPTGQGLFLGETDAQKSQLIDAKGRPRFQGAFTTLYKGTGDFFIASRDSLMGVINLTGKELIPFRFNGLTSQLDMFVVYDQRGKAGVVNMQNRTILPIQYDEIEVLSSTRFLVSQNNKRGLMDAAGKWLLQPEFDPADMGGDYHEGMYGPDQPQQAVLLFKQGMGQLYNLNGQLISDKNWLYSGYTDANGFLTMTDCSGRESVIGPDGKIFAKDAPLRSVTVRTAQELCNAIANDVEIILEDGKYDLGTITDTSEYVGIFDYGFEDRTIVIRNVRNLHIKAKNAGKAEIMVTYSYVPVLKLQYAQNVSFTGIVMGHDINPGHCDGAVLSTSGCTYVVLEKCDLYGSGTYGVEDYGSSFLHVRNTTIRECTRGILWLENTNNAYFIEGVMRDNAGADMVNLNSTFNIYFEQVRFENNEVPTEWGPYDFFRFENNYLPIQVNNCLFKNCTADYFTTDASLLQETNSRKEGLNIRKSFARETSNQ